MKYYSELMKIIDGAIKNDTKKVINYSNHLANKLEKAGEEKVAIRIKSLLANWNNEKDVIFTNKINDDRSQLPYDQESRVELAEIIMPHQIDISNENLILDEKNEKKLHEFINSYRKADKLAELGVDLPTTILLYGPPGCGKTLTAHYLAKSLEIPLLIVRIDTLISSYLGNTAKNIRKIFEYSANNPSVLFLDEFDALAKLRDDQHELGELKRVVNSLLQNIDSLESKSIIIGATNHEKLLDKAIWRRFSTRMHISLPKINERKEAIELYLRKYNYELEDNILDIVASIFQGLSFSDIKQIILNTIRKIIINEKELDVSEIIESLFDYVLNDIEYNNETEKRRKELGYILEKNNNISNRTLATMLKCHHTTIGRDRVVLKI